MNIDYSYYKKRALFGAPYHFNNHGPTLIDNVIGREEQANLYITKALVDKGTQEGPVLSGSEVNTWRPDFADRGIFHDQGGWPKDFNVFDEEAVYRFKRRMEREDNYIASMKELTKPMEHAILQNNSINIYQKYFEGVLEDYSVSESLSQTRNIFRDPNDIIRPISHLSWSPDGETIFATSYCNTNFQKMTPFESTEAYIWNVEIPNSPQMVLDSKIPIVNLEWNSMDKNFLAGGMYTGQVAFYDVRKGPEHVEISPDIVSHRDPVCSVLWTSAKTGMDFFSTSADGVVKWWDCRNLSKIIDSIILDTSKNQNLSQAFGASCLEYDSSIPAKYLVGTENGHVICGNRKGANLSEKLPWIMKTHSGPVHSLQRNAAFSKFFLTVGDWYARIWSEDCKESPIMWTKNYKSYLTKGEWSKSRYSVFFLTRADGFLDLWDLLMEQRYPFVSTKVCERPLIALRVEEQGKFVVVGNDHGKCYLIQYAENLHSVLKNDKTFLSNMFERESRREKILEGRMREIKLAMRLKAQQLENLASKEEITDMENVDLLKAEEDYWEEVNKVLQTTEEEFMEKKESIKEKETLDNEEMEEEEAAQIVSNE